MAKGQGCILTRCFSFISDDHESRMDMMRVQLEGSHLKYGAIAWDVGK